ncbi:MAG: LamG domain-containing protein, partial [Prochloraceae cyanobacterium]|nr:LamG domain-containing protein [Prochloraceae cyanobacterium]
MTSALEAAGLNINDINAILPSSLQQLSDTLSITTPAANQYLLSWQNEINFTELFGVDDFLTDISISNSSLLVTTENTGNSYEFSGEITLGNESFGIGSTFIEEANKLDWEQVSLDDFSFASLASELGGGFQEASDLLDNLGALNLTLSKDSLGGVDLAGTSDIVSLTYSGSNDFSISLQNDINFTSLFNVGSFLPDISIGNATFTSVSTNNGGTNLDFSGDLTVGAETFGIASSFTQASNGLTWNSVAIEDFELGSLATWIGGGIETVDDIFGDALPVIDVTITTDEIDLSGSLDFANSNNQYLSWISNQLGLDQLDVSLSYNTSRDVSLEASIAGNISLISSSQFSATLTDVGLGFSLSGTDLEPSFSISAGLGLEIDGQQLDFTGGIALEPESVTGYFSLDAGEEGWVNPFGIPDTTIRNLGFQIGGTYAAPFIDNVGIIGDLQFGNYDIASAVLFDTNDYDNFALVTTLNEPLSLLDLISGPAASYALGQLGNEVTVVSDAIDLLDSILDVDISSIDSDGDGENDPLIAIVPTATSIAGIELEEGFSINGEVNLWGKKATVELDADQNKIEGSVEIDRIEIGIDDFYDDLLVIEGSDANDRSDDGTLVGGSIIDDGNAGNLVNGTVNNGVLSLDGSDDYVNLGNSEQLQITGNQTLEMWVNPTNFNQRQNPYGKAYGGEGTITIEKDGSLSYYYGITGSNSGTKNVSYQRVQTVSNVLQANQWSHIALVRDFDSNAITWYVNGEKVDLIDSSETIFDAAVAGNDSAYIGKGYVSNFTGQIDDVRVWNTARSAEEISANYNGTLTGSEEGLVGYWNFNDSSVNASTIEDLAGNGVLSLDGSDERVNLGNSEQLQITGNQTLEMWVNP